MKSRASETSVASPSLEPADVSEWECLAELRAELRRSYPTVNVRALYRILRRFGQHSFPPGLLLPVGRERAALSAAARASVAAEQTEDLFSSAFYSLVNPDVAAAGVSPWLHYQVFGRQEGRSPHPLVDTATLALSAEGEGPGELVDRYLSEPRRWLAEIGPYVECRRFALSGMWNGTESPFTQIVREHRESQWVHQRLMVIDSGSVDEVAARLSAVAFLLSQNRGRTRLSAIERWQSGSSAPAPGPATYTVIPGWFFGSNGFAHSVSSAPVVSPDASFVRLTTESVSIASGDNHSCTTLIYLSGWLSHARLSRLVTEATPDTVVAPYSAAQETALRQLRRDTGQSRSITVLPWGRQARVTARHLTEMAAETAPQLPVATLSEAPASSAVVLPISLRRMSTGDPALRSALAAGAALCLIDGALNSWLPIIQSRDTVITHPSLADDVACFIDPERMSLLPQTGERHG